MISLLKVLKVQRAADDYGRNANCCTELLGALKQIFSGWDFKANSTRDAWGAQQGVMELPFLMCLST